MISRNYLACLVAVVVTLGVASAPANAGTYNVNANAGFYGYSWAASPNGSWGGGVFSGGYYIALEMTGHVPVGQKMFWRSPQLPSTLNLDSILYTATWNNNSSSAFPFSTRMCYNGFYNEGAYGTCGGNAVDTFPVRPDGNDWFSGSYVMDRGNACSIDDAATSATHHCAGFAFEATGAYSQGGASLSNVRGTVSDYVAPSTTSSFASHPLSQGNWLRGTVAFGASGSDPNGSGIKSMAFYPGDPTKTLTVTTPCSFGAWVPCGPYNWSGSFNTAGMNDGSHTGYYTSTDAGNNTSQSSPFAFKVDNTNPTTPITIVPETNGEGGWSSNNSVGASWANGAEVSETETRSGLSQVIVDVNPTTGSQTNPAPVTVPIGGSASGIFATTSSISGLALPAAGAWSLRLQLVDRAGNVSDVGDGSGTSADSDISVGYDPNPPAAPQGQANGWISRDELAAGYGQEFTYSAPPSAIAPVCGFAGAIDKNLNGTAGDAINVPGGGDIRSWQLPGTLDEDTHYVHLRAVGCNGIASTTTETVIAPVDRTDPVGTIGGVENGKWYRDGQLVELRGRDVLSGMAPADTDDSDSRNGAYLAHTINGVGPAANLAPRGDSTLIQIAGEGQKELRFAPVDRAGNKAAAKVATFGIDATIPDGYINDQSPARPTLLSAKLTDAPSGISFAVISVRPVGGSDDEWIQLPTSLAGIDGNAVGTAVSAGVATARFPDTSLANGTYDVRVAAFDQAGNPLTSQRHQDGVLARVDNPMRAATGVSVRLFKALRECKKDKTGKMKCTIKKCTKRSKGACYKVLKGKVVLQGGSATVTSAYNRGAIATGVLTDESGVALKNADVAVTTSTKASGKGVKVGVATTDANGIWAVRVPAGVNRAVWATYEGTETRRPSVSSATMNTQAKLKLKVSKKRAKTGQTITFSGRVTPFDATFPSGGKIVALQFFAAKKWRPAVGVGHTDKKGNFKINYKFDGPRVRAKIIFRVVAPSEDAWGHVYSVSKPVRIKLN